MYNYECDGIPSVEALGTEDPNECNSQSNSVSEKVCAPTHTVVGYMGGEGDYPLEDRYLLWGLTLGFLSDTRRRSALATPLIGDGAAGGFDQPFRSGAGGPLVDGAMRMLLFPKKRRSRSQSQPPQIDWWRVLSLWPIQVAIAVVVVGLVKARLAHLREEAGITRGEFDFHPLFRDEL